MHIHVCINKQPSAIERNFCNILMWPWCILMRSIFFIAFLQPRSSPCMQTDYHMGVVPRSHSSIKLRKWSCAVWLSSDPKAFFTTKSLSLKFLTIQIMFHLSTTFDHNMSFWRRKLEQEQVHIWRNDRKRRTDTYKYIRLIWLFLFVTLRMEI